MKKIFFLILLSLLMSCRYPNQKEKADWNKWHYLCSDCKNISYKDFTRYSNGNYVGKTCYSYQKFLFNMKQCEINSTNTEKCQEFLLNNYKTGKNFEEWRYNICKKAAQEEGEKIY